ncbi:hypothetical protein B5F07_18935 [Lachnoclostridium sp. An169]|uniref:alpha/beta hydrolase n=1 Tax=Lachnoclostridium sp. An169 TaxID=1965569 RepID=UPI000B37BFDA|nr:alpha/beta hydrolase-fold protein [Lachnoclostridium sp. An169]OUP81010.1 hypothetical protein B5F07_18935 [Lachnoclostridium sp. An169]HJA65362.1 hypothetical protein [Candidatus Mediterraneibacter cottocaccae]
MKLPDRYYTPCTEPGTVEHIRYTSRAYALERFYGEECPPLEKSMYVYLPYGYDNSKKYNVLYLLHGGTDDEGYWFGEGRFPASDTRIYTDAGNITRNLADHMIQEGSAKPLIIVTPSFNEDVPRFQKRPDYADAYFSNSSYFWMEMENDIMPCIQKRYSVYAEGTTRQDFAAAREHQAYAGASQGSVTGYFSVMEHMADLFAYIGSYSAGMIRFELQPAFHVTADKERMEAAARALRAAPPLRYWYNGCGDRDQMFDTHLATYQYMLDACPEHLTEKNCCFAAGPGGEHNYRQWITDLYRCLKIFFKK